MSVIPTISVSRRIYEGRICLFLFFEPNYEIETMVIDLNGICSKTYGAWYLFEHTLSIHELLVNFSTIARVDISELEPLDGRLTSMCEAPAVFRITGSKRDEESIRNEKERGLHEFTKYMKSQGYRSATIRCYKCHIRKFILSCDLPLDAITDKQVQAHCDMLKQKGLKAAANHFMCGAKLFFWHWNQRILDVHELEFHRKERKKKLRFIPHRTVKAICSYKAVMDFN